MPSSTRGETESVASREFGYFRRARGRWRREIASRFGAKVFFKTDSTPYVSFSFDDFPHSASQDGCPVLEKYGVRGTFFVSMGMLERPSPVGPIASKEDLRSLVENGHEIGCHTFDHRNSSTTGPAAFMESVVRNRLAFRAVFPSEELKVFSYPLDVPVLRIKRLMGRQFFCCRGGRQTFNSRRMDLNLLNAFFLTRQSLTEEKSIRSLINESMTAGGWMIFATHDIAVDPSPFGCTPKYFESIVRFAIEAGARILPIGAVCDELGVMMPIEVQPGGKSVDAWKNE